MTLDAINVRQFQGVSEVVMGRFIFLWEVTNTLMKFLLFVIKIDQCVDVVDLVVGVAEFLRKHGGGGSQGFLCQNVIHLSLDSRRLRLQLPDS